MFSYEWHSEVRFPNPGVPFLIRQLITILEFNVVHGPHAHQALTRGRILILFLVQRLTSPPKLAKQYAKLLCQLPVSSMYVLLYIIDLLDIISRYATLDVFGEPSRFLPGSFT